MNAMEYRMMKQPIYEPLEAMNEKVVAFTARSIEFSPSRAGTKAQLEVGYEHTCPPALPQLSLHEG